MRKGRHDYAAHMDLKLRSVVEIKAGKKPEH
jgi:hypothetical protein